MRKDGLLLWLTGRERRRGKRYVVPDLVAYYWGGSIPTSQPVTDISCTGTYLATDERWHIDTLLMITLQPGQEVHDPNKYITVPCRVIRHGRDGVGLDFMLTTKEEHRAIERFL